MKGFKQITASVQQLFPPAQQAQVEGFLMDARARLSLSRKHITLLLEDHVRALAYFTQRGVSLSEAIQRLDPAQLGDFYLKEREDWYPLDHAAKIYPLSMSTKRMTVFRLSAYLKQPVVPQVLQMALTYTMKRFPYYATTIKSGFFWHYLDSAMRRFAARPETKLPCAIMRVNRGSSPSLRVVYYQNRISVEFFHILTDGTGASIFVRTLLREYLRLLGHHIPTREGVFDAADTPEPQEWQDDFTMGDHSQGAHGFADKRALQLWGLTSYEQPCRVLHFHLPVSQLSARAKELGGTITALLLSYLMLACKAALPPTRWRKKVQIQLPVNMRKYYPSHTLRNFSLYCSIRLHPSQITTPAEMVPGLGEQIREGGSKENLDQTMHLSRRLVKLLRFVPLIIKRPIAYFVYGALSDAVFTTTFSNLGPIRLPEEMAPFVDKFDFVLGPPVRNKACCSLCSYGDTAVLTLTKITQLSTLEDSLYRLLVEEGFTPYVEGSD